jgi:hypothetical protein
VHGHAAVRRLVQQRPEAVGDGLVARAGPHLGLADAAERMHAGGKQRGEGRELSTQRGQRVDRVAGAPDGRRAQRQHAVVDPSRHLVGRRPRPREQGVGAAERPQGHRVHEEQLLLDGQAECVRAVETIRRAQRGESLP